MVPTTLSMLKIASAPAWLMATIFLLVYGEITFAAAPQTPQEKQAIAALQQWARLKAGNGPMGRPLPVAGTWDAGSTEYSQILVQGLKIGDTPHGRSVQPLDTTPSPLYAISQIKLGHIIIPTFEDVTSRVQRQKPELLYNDPRFTRYFEAYYRPALEYCRDNKLPITIRGWNWAADIIGIDNSPSARPVAEAGTARLLRSGKAVGLADPFGPVSRWEEWGTLWMGNEVARKIQEIYPDPPLVLFLNNNEAAMVSISEIDDTCDRYVAIHGTGKDLPYRARAIREGYAERYKALFAAARRAFTQEAWRKNSLFVAYNNTAAQIMGRDNGTPGPSNGEVTGQVSFDENEGYALHDYDGGMPEFYDNMWQAPGKHDAGPWSPQTEAMNLIAYQDAKVWQQNPNYYWSSIVWGGDLPSTAHSRFFRYLLEDANPPGKWNMDRYTGMLQFGLWMIRPRDYREFNYRGDLRGFAGLTLKALMESVDRVNYTPQLAEFWRFGKLVPNPVFTNKKHYFPGSAKWPQWLKDMDRWFLLTSDANPPEKTWPDRSAADKVGLRVMAMALCLDEAPRRRWLIYAHAPLGSVAGSAVSLPGYGQVSLDYVTQHGAFFLVSEATRQVSTLFRGGKPELGLTASTRYLGQKGVVKVRPQVLNPAGGPFIQFTWKVAGQRDKIAANAAEQEFSMTRPGEYLISLEAKTKDGVSALAQVPVWVVEKQPAADTIFDVSLSQAYESTGPWGTNETDGTLRTFSLLPNASSFTKREPVLLGGKFVVDEERGRVLEFTSPQDGVLFPRTVRTGNHPIGFSDTVVSFHFKAEDVERRQVLYTEGGPERPGRSIYLEGGRLHAGTYVPKVLIGPEGWTSGPVEAGKWNHVEFRISGAQVLDYEGVAQLYLNGKQVGSAAAACLPLYFGLPRLGMVAGTVSNQLGPKVVATAKDFFRGRFSGFSLAVGSALAASGSTTLKAVNAGGSAITGTFGTQYAADAGFQGGVALDLPETAPLEADFDASVFRSMRTGPSFQYLVAVPDGEYNVRLLFVEPEYRPTPRRIRVDIQGQPVIKDLQIAARVGVLRALDISLPARVTDGRLIIGLTGIAGDAVLSGIIVEKPTRALNASQ